MSDAPGTHDCDASGCEGPARRAHEGRVRQGKPAFIDDDEWYRNTLRTLRREERLAAERQARD